MQPIVPDAAARTLKRFEGQRCYVHFEFCRGGFVRNLAAEVLEAHLRGEGPYRVALRCQGDGWVIMEELTHVAAPAGAGPVFFGGFESDQRLARSLQISLEPFAP